MTLNHQYITMISMMLCGAGLGLLFDFYRIIAKESWLVRKMIHFLDILYWLVATFIIFIILYKSNGAQIRPITLIAILIGALIYFGLASSIFVPVMQKSVRMVKSIVHSIIRPLRFICGFLVATSIFLYTIVVQLLHSIWQRFRSKE